MENNKVVITGFINAGFELDHVVFGKEFYKSHIVSCRESGTEDVIPVILQDRKMEQKPEDYANKYVRVEGEFRSHDFRGNQDRKKFLYVFAREIKIIESDYKSDTNEIFLDGYLCKEPVYRKTPFGREIADVIIAVNRFNKKTDYIPCIFWGRNARMASSTKVGTRLGITGRMQSRNYVKKNPDGTSKNKTAYEISVSSLEVLG